MKYVDLNCDLGEGAGRDRELMPLISSANIACGAHAGDVSTMRETVALARAHRVAIGAHPGFADREHFGRRELTLSDLALRELLVRQVGLLREITEVHHVKLHGALYNLAARDERVAEIAADALCSIDRAIIVYALAGSRLVDAARSRGLVVAQEAFADRRYQGDGSLVPRSHPCAMIEQSADAVTQALRMVNEGMVATLGGAEIPITADTLCVHGDGAHAVEFASELRRALEAAGVSIRAIVT